ncbi:THxN family PEP-CTERM protein [Undibacterium sp.]|uniref:THxN family PEP-CTERM protein n=1 Tax=Undibacterium sp. TaxID=1914977 RepID=UPI0025DCF202|nr:THxN family PEP-CTERM protein [Undibacterium sp.]
MFKKLFTKGSIKGLTAVLATVVSCSAMATPVTQWEFEVNSGFTSFAPAGVTGSNQNAFLNGLGNPMAASLLSWGTSTGSGQSSLGIGAATNGNFNGSLFTGAPAVNTVEVIHNNRPITGASLGSAHLLDVIRLKRLLPGPTGSDLFTGLTFDFKFKETPNQNPCTVASPTPCNDILVVDALGAGFDPATGSLTQNFMYEGDNYAAILHIVGMGVLSNAACADAGAPNGCYGFTTVENKENRFQVSLEIQNRIPEPASVGLVGLALVAMGLARRRKGVNS